MRRVTICLVGIDGSGKTTHLSALMRELNERGLNCKYVHMSGGYYRFLSLPFLLFCRLLGYEKAIVVNGRKFYTRHPNLAHRNTAISQLWPIFFLFDMSIVTLLLKRPSFRSGILLCDRYTILDSIVDLMVALGDDSLSDRAVIKLFSLIMRPTMPLLLDVDKREALQRKKGTPGSELLGQRIDLYRKMASDLGIPIVDASKSFAVVHENVTDHVKRVVPGWRKK